jgi:hypothetical protein
VGINRQGLLQLEAAFHRAVIQILDKVIPLLVFKGDPTVLEPGMTVWIRR